jgi:hypothetical protein
MKKKELSWSFITATITGLWRETHEHFLLEYSHREILLDIIPTILCLPQNLFIISQVVDKKTWFSMHILLKKMKRGQ